MHKPAHTIEHLSGEANETHYGQSVGLLEQIVACSSGFIALTAKIVLKDWKSY